MDHVTRSSRSGPTLTETLETVSREARFPHVSIGEIVEALKERAYGGLILVFALPNLSPLPPGASTVLGVPLIFLVVQLMLGVKPWLPKRVGRRSLARSTLAGIVRRVGPWLAASERLLKPRWTRMLAGPAERVVGGVCVLLGTVLILPVPLGNFPPAVALCLFALGLLEREGLFILGGLLTAGLAFAAAAGGVLIMAGTLQSFMEYLGRYPTG